MTKRVVLVTLVSLFIAIAACAPTSAPPPVITTQTPTSAPVSQPKIAPPPSAEDAAWQKVIDTAKQEGKLTIYSFGMLGDMGITVARAFKDKYGISVDIITGQGAQFVERIKTEQRMKQVTVDVLDGNPTHLLGLKAAGFTVNVKDLPALRDKNAWRVDPLINDDEGHLMGVRVLPYTPWINTKLIKSGEEPKSYKDLLQPQWKGKIAAGDPGLTTADYVSFVTLLNHKNIDLDVVRDLGKQQITFFPGIIEASRAVARGEYPINLSNSYVSYASFVKEGAPIKPIAMAEGVVMQVSTIGAIKNSPHPNGALLFVNWMVSQEGQAVYAKVLGVTPVRKDVPDYSPSPMEIPKVVAQTQDDSNDVTKKFTDKFLVQLWKGQ